jgi:hypothetical protein
VWNREGSDPRRDSHSDGVENFARHALQRGAQEIPRVAVRHLDFGQGSEIPTNVVPLHAQPAGIEPALEFVKEDKNEKADEDMPPGAWFFSPSTGG